MRWRGERESENIEDRRGLSGGRIAIGGGLGTLVILVIALLFGINPQQLLQGLPDQNQPGIQSPSSQSPQEEELKKFSAVVLAKFYAWDVGPASTVVPQGL